MKTKISTFLTVGGAIVVLLASVVELTFERRLKEMSDSALRSRLEEKVDTIWHLLAQQYPRNPNDKSDPSEHSDFGALSNVFWHQREFGELEAQLSWVESFRIFSQLVGSVMILIGTGGKKETA